MVQLGRLVAGVIALSGATGVVATCKPGETTKLDDASDANLFKDYPSIVKARSADGPDLRILSLGASIMSGQGSPQHSGLRKWLRMGLRNDDWDVNMVGSKQNGTDLKDDDHEAEPGAVLTTIRKNLQKSLGYKANVVIINAGTNNANQGWDLPNTSKTMEAILTDIWGADGMEDTCVILSTLLPTTNAKGKKNRLGINDKYRNLVKAYAKKKCIYLADMETKGELADFFGLNKPLWADNPKVHPNNEGHKRVAYVFYTALQQALKDGKVEEPAAAKEPDNGCDKEFGSKVSADDVSAGNKITASV